MAGRKRNLFKRRQVLPGTSQIMQGVILACIPGLLVSSWFFGWGTLINVVWLCLWALIFEALVLHFRKRDISFFLKDYSALLTAVLLALCLPPSAPWWTGITGIFFAIVIAKQLYGGLGYNIFNPAIVGYVVLLIAFPLEMSTWISPRGMGDSLPAFSESFSAIFFPQGRDYIDGFVGATALDVFKLQRDGMQVSEFWQQHALLFGSWSGRGWEWINLAFLAGGLILLYKKIISWHIPVAMLLSMALLAAFFYDNGSSASHGSPLMHLLGGGTMLGAFFIATDPVTAASSAKGKLIYGALIGILTYIIRVWGAYPDGVAFAVLLGNFAAPMIDYYAKPKTQETEPSL